jgi:cyclic pyranopterin phosphate synthase
VPSAELVQRIAQQWPMTPVERNYHGEVANRYRFTDGQGEVGFISSVSEPFCGSCTRIRLSSDGRLFTCLFAASGTNLKGPLRDGADDEALLGIVKQVWGERADRYSEVRAEQDEPSNKVEMYYIGG